MSNSESQETNGELKMKSPFPELVKRLMPTLAMQKILELPQEEQSRVLKVFSKQLIRKLSKQSQPETTETTSQENQEMMPDNSSFAIARQRKSNQDAS